MAAYPPYMGSSSFDPFMSKWVKKRYPDSCKDLCTVFIDRGYSLARDGGYAAMVTMQSWMFLGSFEKMRKRIIDEKTIAAMAHLGPRAFDAIGGEALAQLFDGQIVLPRNLLYSGIHHLVVDTDAGSPGALQNRALRDETFEHLRPQLLHGRQIDLLAAEVDRHGVHALHQFLFGDDFIVDDSNDAVEIRFKRRSCGVLLKRNLRGFGGFCCGGWSLIRIDMSRSRLIHDACRKNGAGGQSGQKRRRGTQNG